MKAGKDDMKVGIICAADTELAPFLPMIKKCSVTEKVMLRLHEGEIENIEIVTLFSGVCRVNAAIATQILIDTYGCTLMINAGTAGAMTESVQTFDTVVSTEAAYHDVDEEILTDFHPWLSSAYFRADKSLVALARNAASKLHTTHKTVFGRMVTGEKFIEDQAKDAINAAHSPLSVDMETAAVAHVCYVNKIPFIAVRTITDSANYSSSNDFERNCEKASQLSADFVRIMLRELNIMAEKQ